MRFSSEIVRAMQALAVEQRRLLGPRANWHVGDVAWGIRQHEGRESEWKIRLWVEDGRVVAWSWLKDDGRATLELEVHRDHLHLLDEILDEPKAQVAYAFEDDSELRAALARHGFTQPQESPMHFNSLTMDEPPEPPELPDGFRYRTAGDDLAERVAIHRDVWSSPDRPSRFTEASYAQVREEWPYRESLDCVVEAPEGRFAAYALLWPDDASSVGELEPVGVRDEFRRRGLGAAVCTYALRRWYDEGGRQAIVYCVTDAACALYESIGFRRHASLVGYARQSQRSASGKITAP